MQPLGWRCLAVFCPYHPQLVAACGVTQRKQVHFYDFLARTMVRTVTLSEWPTALAACAAAPIVAVGGASGGVRLAAHPFDASDNALFAPADMVMHASSVRSLHFVGDSLLYTASEDEVAQWNLPLF